MLSDQLNCMTLLAVVYLDWKLKLLEEDGRGGLEWAPNCIIQIQISSTSEITGVWSQVWSRCFAYLKVCLSFSSSVVDLFEIHLTLKWLGSLLQLSNLRERIMEGKLLSWAYMDQRCVWVYMFFFLPWGEVRFRVTWHWSGEEVPLGDERQHVSIYPNIYWQMRSMCLSE